MMEESITATTSFRVLFDLDNCLSIWHQTFISTKVFPKKPYTI